MPWIHVTEEHRIESQRCLMGFRHWVQWHRRKVIDPATLPYRKGRDAEFKGVEISLRDGTSFSIEAALEERSP